MLAHPNTNRQPTPNPTSWPTSCHLDLDIIRELWNRYSRGGGHMNGYVVGFSAISRRWCVYRT